MILRWITSGSGLIQGINSVTVSDLIKLTPRPCPHYTGAIWKRNVLSTVRRTVHTNPFYENGVFRKRSSNRRKFKIAGFSFWCWRSTVWIITWFPTPGFWRSANGNLTRIYTLHENRLRAISLLFENRGDERQSSKRASVTCDYRCWEPLSAIWCRRY